VGQTAISQNGKLIAYTLAVPVAADSVIRYVAHVSVVSTDGRMHHQFTRGQISCFQPAFSPDGQFLSFLTRRLSATEQRIWMLPLAGGESWPVSDAGSDILSYKWSPDSRHIMYLANSRHPAENSLLGRHCGIITLNDQGLPQQSGARDVAYPDIIAFEWSSTPGVVLLSHRSRAGTFVIARLNLDTGAYALIRHTEFPVISLRSSGNGKHIAYSMKNGLSGGYQLYSMRSDGGQVRQIPGPEASQPEVIGWAHDNKTLLYADQIATARQIFSFALGGDSSECLTSGAGLYRDLCISADGRTMAFVHETTALPANVYVSGVSQNAKGKLTNLNTELAGQPVSRTEHISWQSRDLTTLHGLLTYPSNYAYDRRYPLLLMINNEPDAPFLEDFTQTVHAFPVDLLSRNGYAVLRANYPRQNHAGPISADDYLSAVNAVLGMGVAHPDSLCLFGWNSSGASALGLALQSNRFKVVSVSSGDYTAFHAIPRRNADHFESTNNIGWQTLAESFGNSANFKIKGFDVPAQMLLLDSDSTDTQAALNFHHLLSEHNCPAELNRFAVSQGPGDIACIESMHRRMVSWFEQHLRGIKILE
jgi:dipeptidyl aminopeptidase/acylaminoacyl peptidase